MWTKIIQKEININFIYKDNENNKYNSSLILH